MPRQHSTVFKHPDGWMPGDPEPDESVIWRQTCECGVTLETPAGTPFSVTHGCGAVVRFPDKPEDLLNDEGQARGRTPE